MTTNIPWMVITEDLADEELEAYFIIATEFDSRKWMNPMSHYNFETGRWEEGR